MSALDRQVAGNHYKAKKIQPVEYIHANDLGFLEGCIVKRITRWRDKDGFQDLEKIKHEVDLLIELETRKRKEAALANTTSIPGGDPLLDPSRIHLGAAVADHAGQDLSDRVQPPAKP
jgi:hypothetical protein